MSQPATDHPTSILARGAGRWEGEERLAPAPWAPDGSTATGRTSARLVLGGWGLASDYTQEVEGRTTLHAHTLIRWDAEAGGFVMHFHGRPGGGPTVLRGRAHGDGLVLEGEGSGGTMRQTFAWDDGTMEVLSEGRDPDSGEWSTLFEGRYRRLPAEASGAEPGAVAWTDLTVDDAPAMRDFYASVVGWTPAEVSMGDYADYNMCSPDGRPVAGVCHARGGNADLPPGWLSYVVVEDLDASLEACRAGGGDVVGAVRSMGDARWAVIRDPAGAALALYEAG